VTTTLRILKRQLQSMFCCSARTLPWSSNSADTRAPTAICVGEVRVEGVGGHVRPTRRDSQHAWLILAVVLMCKRGWKQRQCARHTPLHCRRHHLSDVVLKLTEPQTETSRDPRGRPAHMHRKAAKQRCVNEKNCQVEAAGAQ
jgi:hypothetical protein